MILDTIYVLGAGMMAGWCEASVTRIFGLALQCGSRILIQDAGKIEEGKREMSFELYLAMNQWLLAMGNNASMFARAYILCTWNLSCRTENTLTICHKHLIWQSESIGIPLHSPEK